MIFCIYGKWKASTWKIRQKDSSSVLLNYQKCINEKFIRWKMQNTLLSKRTSVLTGHNRLNFYDQKKFSAKFKWEWKSRSVRNIQKKQNKFLLSFFARKHVWIWKCSYIVLNSSFFNVKLLFLVNDKSIKNTLDFDCQLELSLWIYGNIDYFSKLM